MGIWVRIKKWYIDFLEKEKKNFFEKVFYFFLFLLSLLYGLAIGIKNFLYDFQFKKPFRSKRKIISIGNLLWGGSGKTSLACYLYQKLSPYFKVAILRRGYGEDEEKLIKEKCPFVFSAPNRIDLVKRYARNFDVFILDDGFQYRGLYRNIDIVIMEGREFRRKIRLIPASFFREGLKSLKRANFLILNYKEQFDAYSVKNRLVKEFVGFKIYLASYEFRRFLNLEGEEVEPSYFFEKKVAALCAIGYPEGFFNKIKGLKLNLVRTFIYPDHYVLNRRDFLGIEKELSAEGINDLIISGKDKYHLPHIQTNLNIFILEVELKIENEESFLKEIRRYLE